ncbi:DUF1697 domain-containing protein [Pseudoalteromonas sp. OOF1S-7]|uniref:DUF1697 domain-containing protein n=1 Tax=Pseudoalteromonas sp. OOF1S-7 TaxID=2917757 RepID=UPI001EF6AD3B|nr:DUF1697 domain-containing protein [Pseudoalteromonas sp. OOF1S-7]MCG7534778.1 DUF1697 domain-containing protein [Pseudoalteromonas sp. OOF1S-7]
MKKYIVLLRGINVSGKNILPMKELVNILEGIGCENVRTYIQSGNLVLHSNLSASLLEKSIAEALANTKGFDVPVIAQTVSKFKTAVEACPFQATEGKLLHYFFMASTPILNNDSLLSLCASSERYKLKDNIFYLYAPDGIGRSKLVANIEKVLGVPATARNHNTVQKLLKLTE